MKSIKTKIVLSLVIFLSAVGIVSAASSSLYVSPTSATKNVGEAFTVSVGVNASGNKVCGAEGTLVFNNLSCQSITVTGGLMTQSSPTCSSPYFLVGIPSCTTVDKALFTVSVVGSAGSGSISATGVDVIGEGASLGSAHLDGNYTINAVVVPTPVPAVVPTLITPVTPVTPKTPIIPITQNDGFVGYVNGKIQVFTTLEAAQKAGATNIEPNYKYKPAGVIKVATTTNEKVTTIQPKETIPPLATVDKTGSETGSAWKIIVGVIILIIAGYVGYIYKKKKDSHNYKS